MENGYVIKLGQQVGLADSENDVNSRAEIDVLFTAWRKSRSQKISIWFHGGLVDEQTGLACAQKMSKVLHDAGNLPICFIWKTGLHETLSSNIHHISETRLFKKIRLILLRKLIEKIGLGFVGGRGQPVLPVEMEIQNELLKPIPFAHYPTTIVNTTGRGPVNALASIQGSLAASALEAELTPLIVGDPEFRDLLSSDPQATRGIVSLSVLIRNLAQILYRVIQRFHSRHDHGFYPTLIEEILRELYIADLGAWTWNGMKEKAQGMWDQGIGHHFLERLLEYWQEFPETSVNLIGHSAGSIVICHLLDQTAKLGIRQKFKSVLFLSPACRTELFYTTIASHSERFSLFRCFTMTDEVERQDVLVPYVYTRSLLYLISGILEEKGNAHDATILGLERHINHQSPYDQDTQLEFLHLFLYQAGTNRLVLSPTNDQIPAGLRTQARKHGDFDDDPSTLESIKFIIQ